MEFKEFLADIHSSLNSFSADIDDITVKTNVVEQLKIFGNNICELTELKLKVENSKASLPKEFKSLRLALKVKPIGCDTHGHRNYLQTDNYIYKQYISEPAYFDEINLEYVKTCESKIITQTITIGEHPVDFYFEHEYLSLVKGINKTLLASDCVNIHPSIRNSHPHEINITGTTINTNFRDGELYVQYYGIPVDEDGEVVIPEITTGDILAYIKNYVKIQIAEELIANNKNPLGLAQLYPVWAQKDRELKRAAIVEAKFAGLSKNWHVKYKRLNKRDTSIFKLPSLIH